MRKKWKCPACGFEAVGYGVYSHQKKHENAPIYTAWIKDHNHKLMMNLQNNSKPYIHIIDDVWQSVHEMGKTRFEKGKYLKKIIEMLKDVPNVLWLYFFYRLGLFEHVNNIGQYEIAKKQLAKMGIESIEVPKLLHASYKNYIEIFESKEFKKFAQKHRLKS